VIEEHEVELTGGERTTVIDIPGPPGAPTVVLLHGLGATARLNWGPCFIPLSRSFRVLSMDHRGHGRGLRTRRFRLGECAADAARIARARDIDRFIAVGYSMGGPIASLLWREFPDQVSGLVLCATARHFVPRTIARASSWVLPPVAHAARFTPRPVRRRALRRVLADIAYPELRGYVEAELAGHQPGSVIEAAHEITGFSSHDWIGQVNVPTSVIVTTRDQLVPPSRQRKLAASIPGARLFEVDGDHGACIRRADVFVPTLVRACSDVSRRAQLEQEH